MDGNVENYAEDATIGAGDVNFESEDAAYEAGDAAYGTGDAAYETGDGAFETGDMPEETGNVTEEIGNITGEVDNSHELKQEHPTVVGTEAVEKRWPGWPGESVFRILIPAHKVGGLIGRKGEFIKKMCDETKARIKILEAPKGVPERAVIISAKEEPDASLPPAIDGLLRVHKRIIDGLEAESAQVLPSANVGPTRLLVAATQAGSLIGKQGASIKTIQEGSGSVVRVLESLPPIALQDDRVVEIQGEPSAMHKAVELIANHLRKFLVDRSILPLFEKNMLMPNMHMEHTMPPPHPWAPPQGVPPNAGPPGYGSNPQFMPPRPHESYYPPPEYPPLEKQPHHGISMYGQNAPSMGANASANQQKSMVSQVTHHMQIPLSYADAVIGSAGANISYIRRASGATITIQESRMAPGEMTVEITGSATQVQAAEQLIQNFMADAAPGQAPAPAPGTMGPADQSYNSYQVHGSVYGSQQSSAASAHMGGGYGSAYGTNYGY